MGDSTRLNLDLHACPAYRARSVLDVVEYWGLATEELDPARHLQLGAPYRNGDYSGTTAAFAGQLVTVAPEVAFTVWDEPYEGALGSVVRYAPELGTHATDCDGDGNAYFPLDAVEAILSIDNATERAFTLGRPWLDVCRGPAETETVPEPTRFGLSWDRSDGKVLICWNDDDPSHDEQFDGPKVSMTDEFSAELIDQALADHDLIRASDWWTRDRRGRLIDTEIYKHVAHDGTPLPVTVGMHHIALYPS